MKAEILEKLSWEDVQDIWWITDKILRSIPENFEDWPEWAFSSEGRFTKALNQLKEMQNEMGTKR